MSQWTVEAQKLEDRIAAAEQAGIALSGRVDAVVSGTIIDLAAVASTLDDLAARMTALEARVTALEPVVVPPPPPAPARSVFEETWASGVVDPAKFSTPGAHIVDDNHQKFIHGTQPLRHDGTLWMRHLLIFAPRSILQDTHVEWYWKIIRGTANPQLGDEYWMAWSARYALGMETDGDGTTVWQTHQQKRPPEEVSGNPPQAIQLNNDGRLQLVVRRRAGDNPLVAPDSVVRAIPGQDPALTGLGNIHDWVVKCRYHYDTTGYVKLWHKMASAQWPANAYLNPTVEVLGGVCMNFNNDEEQGAVKSGVYQHGWPLDFPAPPLSGPWVDNTMIRAVMASGDDAVDFDAVDPARPPT